MLIARGRQALSLTPENGLFVGLRLAGRGKSIGFTVKTERQLTFRERNNLARKGVKLGRWYFNTLKNANKKPAAKPNRGREWKDD